MGQRTMRGSTATRRSTCQGVKALAGRLLTVLLWAVAGAVMVAFRVLLVLLLRVLQPFVTWPLLAGCLGGMGATAGFAAAQMWGDALRAGFVTLTCALIFGLYAAAVQAIIPEFFDQAPSRQRQPWATEGRIHDDAQ